MAEAELSVPQIEMVIGICAIAFERFLEICDRRGGIVAAVLCGAKVVVDLVERHGAGDQLKGRLRACEIPVVVLRESQEELRFKIMRIAACNALKPAGSDFVFLPVPINLAQLKARLRVMLVQSGRLREETMALLSGGGEQAAHIVLYRVDAHRRARCHKLRLRRSLLWTERVERLPAEAHFERSKVFERASLAQHRT